MLYFSKNTSRIRLKTIKDRWRFIWRPYWTNQNFFFRFTILGYSVTCLQNFMQIGEPCFWTTLHGFTGDTLLNDNVSILISVSQTYFGNISWTLSLLGMWGISGLKKNPQTLRLFNYALDIQEKLYRTGTIIFLVCYSAKYIRSK